MIDTENPRFRINAKQTAKKLVHTTEYKIADVLIQRSVIEKAMNDLGLQHPGRRGFIEDVLK